MRPEDALTKIRSSVHSPGPIRVLGPLSNSWWVRLKQAVWIYWYEFKHQHTFCLYLCIYVHSGFLPFFQGLCSCVCLSQRVQNEPSKEVLGLVDEKKKGEMLIVVEWKKTQEEIAFKPFIRCPAFAFYPPATPNHLSSRRHQFPLSLFSFISPLLTPVAVECGSSVQTEEGEEGKKGMLFFGLSSSLERETRTSDVPSAATRRVAKKSQILLNDWR